MKLKKAILQVIDGIILPPSLAVLKNDGGVSSQIAFWALGYELQLKGYDVKHDLSWFTENGKDSNGIYARNFDFCKAFPNLKIVEASEKEIKLSKALQNFKVGDPFSVQTPAYINGYFEERWACIVRHSRLLSENFQPLKSFNREDHLVLHDITTWNHSCGVHVRRGDLAQDHAVYGKVISPSYFLKAIDRISSMYGDVKFFFFSDEAEWIEEHLLPHLKSSTNFFVSKCNGSDRGFVDLYLLSKCDSLISSQGAFGKMARILGDDPSRIIVEPSSRTTFDPNDEKKIVIEN